MKRCCIPMECSDNLPSKVALVERNTMPQGIALVDPEAVAESTQKDLVTLAVEIQKADSFVKANACSKLQVIAQQMRFLKKQAENVLFEAERNVKLHHAACNFVKHPGHVYHLYQRESDQLYFSMLSPEEWGNSAPAQTYKGSFRLEHDHTWTPLQETSAKDNELAVLRKILPGDLSGSTIFQNVDLNLDM